ncbi:MAG: T9SS type A sorting domain-containing protein [Bacteroidales bacterium]|nr:T9SS type A sorting domain-containing protein [Bacteroidales bacterium]MCF8402906.1 T9SS type A sorting domain-containing protein [Bacteroidales bacterium]
MKKLFCLFVIFHLLISFSHAQWYWQYPVPQGNRVNDITHKGNMEKFYAVGNYGAILKNNISDTLWTKLDSITDLHLNAITFTEAGTGYIVGEEGLILQSTEEDIWNVKESYTHYKLNGVDFIDEETGFAVGHKGIILKILPDTCIQGFPVTFKELTAIQFVSATHGFIVGDSGVILRTINGGISWEAKYINDSLHFTNLHFPSESIGYVIGKKGKIWKTINGGDSWNNVSFQSVGDDLHGVSFINDTIGMICGRSGRIIETVNGGSTWDSFDTLTNADFQDLFVYDFDKITIKPIVVGEYGSIFRKFEREYVNISGATHYSLSSINFSTATEGYAVGGDFFANIPIVLYTNDATNWIDITPDTLDRYITDVELSDNFNFVCGFKGRIFRFTSAGGSWEQLVTGTTNDFYDIDIVEGNYVFACGEKGTLLKSADYGDTWEQLNLPSSVATKNIYSLDFNSYNLGYAVGAGGTILKLKDGGYQISKVDSPVTASLYDIDLSSQNGEGYIVGSNGAFLRLKQDSGSDLVTMLTSGFTIPFNKVRCTSIDSVYIAAENGIILFSEYAGDTLHRQFGNTSNHLRALYIQNNMNAWVGGAGLSILKTTNGGGGAYWPNDIEEIELAEPTFAVYPNPASGKVSIEYELTSDAQVNLFMYNLTGQLVSHVFSQKLSPGIKHSDFDVSAIHKGIYILVLRINDYAISEKLIILD